MSYSSYNPNTRYRDRSQYRTRAFFKLLFWVVVLCGGGFWVGKEFSVSQIHVLKEQVETLQSERSGVQDEMTDLRAQVQTANTRYEALKATYDDTFEGPMKDLLTDLETKIEKGMEPARLAKIIRSAGAPRQCKQPETKRFVVDTPTYSGPNTGVKVAEGMIGVTANGVSARNKNGNPEAWYDASKKVSVTLNPSGGTAVKKHAVMPFNYSLIHDNREYRFQFEAGVKSFIKVTFDSCAVL